MAVRRIVANFPTDNPAAARNFYEQVFGLRVAMDQGWILTFSADTKSSPQLSIASQGGSGTPVPDLSIEVDDLQATYERAQQFGHDVTYGIKTEPWGVRRFYLRDPLGKIINVMQHIDRKPVVRLAVETELSRVRRIAETSFEPFVERIGRKPAPMIADFGAHQAAGQLFVALAFGQIAGYIVLINRQSDVLVDNLAIDPEFRGQGLARLLLDHAHKVTLEVRLSLLTLYTNTEMTDAIALYKHLGWRETGRIQEAGFSRVYFEQDRQEIGGD